MKYILLCMVLLGYIVSGCTGQQDMSPPTVYEGDILHTITPVIINTSINNTINTTINSSINISQNISSIYNWINTSLNNISSINQSINKTNETNESII
jgi:hypothetical protein